MKRPRCTSLLDTSDINCDLLILAAEAASAPARFPKSIRAPSSHISPTSPYPSHPKLRRSLAPSPKISACKPIQAPHKDMQRESPIKYTNLSSNQLILQDRAKIGGLQVPQSPEIPRKTTKHCPALATRNPDSPTLLHPRRAMNPLQAPHFNPDSNSQQHFYPTQPPMLHDKRISSPCPLQRGRSSSGRCKHLICGPQVFHKVHANLPDETITVGRDMEHVGRPCSSASSLEQCLKDLEESLIARSIFRCTMEGRASMGVGKSVRTRHTENDTAGATASPHRTSGSGERPKNLMESHPSEAQGRVLPEREHRALARVIGRGVAPKMKNAASTRGAIKEARVGRCHKTVLPPSQVPGAHFDALIASGRIDKHLQRVERKLRRAEKRHTRKGGVR